MEKEIARGRRRDVKFLKGLFRRGVNKFIKELRIDLFLLFFKESARGCLRIKRKIRKII